MALLGYHDPMMINGGAQPGGMQVAPRHQDVANLYGLTSFAVKVASRVGLLWPAALALAAFALTVYACCALSPVAGVAGRGVVRKNFKAVLLRRAR